VWVGRDIKTTDEPVLDVWLGYTPLDAAQRTNRTYGYLSVKKPKIPGIIHAVWPLVTWFTENIFREDKEIVEFEQRAYDAQGTDLNNEVFPPLRDLRGVLARCGRPMT
jgi:renierapurpurin 18,18'-hydroxylase